MPSDAPPSIPFQFSAQQSRELGRVEKPHVILMPMGRSRFIARSRPATFAGQLLVLFRPLLLLLGFLFRIIWKVVFSWWVNPLLDRWMQKFFANEVKEAMPFLFDQFAGRVIPDPRPEANDPGRSYLTIATSNLVLKFSRWRSEDYEIRISPLFAPTDSYDFIDSLEAAGFTQDSSLSPAAESWYHFGKFWSHVFMCWSKLSRKITFRRLKRSCLKYACIPGGVLEI